MSTYTFWSNSPESARVKAIIMALAYKRYKLELTDSYDDADFWMIDSTQHYDESALLSQYQAASNPRVAFLTKDITAQLPHQAWQPIAIPPSVSAVLKWYETEPQAEILEGVLDGEDAADKETELPSESVDDLLDISELDEPNPSENLSKDTESSAEVAEITAPESQEVSELASDEIVEPILAPPMPEEAEATLEVPVQADSSSEPASEEMFVETVSEEIDADTDAAQENVSESKDKKKSKKGLIGAMAGLGGGAVAAASALVSGNKPKDSGEISDESEPKLLLSADDSDAASSLEVAENDSQSNEPKIVLSVEEGAPVEIDDPSLAQDEPKIVLTVDEESAPEEVALAEIDADYSVMAEDNAPVKLSVESLADLDSEEIEAAIEADVVSELSTESMSSELLEEVSDLEIDESVEATIEHADEPIDLELSEVVENAVDSVSSDSADITTEIKSDFEIGNDEIVSLDAEISSGIADELAEALEMDNEVDALILDSETSIEEVSEVLLDSEEDVTEIIEADTLDEIDEEALLRSAVEATTPKPEPRILKGSEASINAQSNTVPVTPVRQEPGGSLVLKLEDNNLEVKPETADDVIADDEVIINDAPAIDNDDRDAIELEIENMLVDQGEGSPLVTSSDSAPAASGVAASAIAAAAASTSKTEVQPSVKQSSAEKPELNLLDIALTDQPWATAPFKLKAWPNVAKFGRDKVITITCSHLFNRYHTLEQAASYGLQEQVLYNLLTDAFEQGKLEIEGGASASVEVSEKTEKLSAPAENNADLSDVSADDAPKPDDDAMEIVHFISDED